MDYAIKVILMHFWYLPGPFLLVLEYLYHDTWFFRFCGIFFYQLILME